MNSIKNILSLFIVMPLMLSISKAESIQQRFAKNSNDPIDTILKKDSSIEALKDPKKGFKNLFVESKIADGINSRQLNPQAISFVKDYMSKHSRNLQKMKDWGRPYFDMMDGILTQYGLPRELKYLAVIESHLKSNAISWAGAVGPWQFMPGTARAYGLKVTHEYDERTDYVKSTHAASKMLKKLFSQYGDWLLVIAAYNGGPGNVNSAIRRSGSRDFWKLQYHLPNESKDHVKKFISTHYIMEGEGGATTLTKEEMKEALLHSQQLSQEELDNSKTHSIGPRYNAAVIMKYVQMDKQTFYRYNPDYAGKITETGSYSLRLPADKMDIFLNKKYLILEESVQILLTQ